ncbi:NepR family anti-sigma factor [Pararhizobium sp. LjRoot238]|uniref:NepR family anti-sigma factor n=1 Tax=Pararhizobium sp. LjRoot238 TaxID=3342293 RepID=UPI003ECFCC94
MSYKIGTGPGAAKPVRADNPNAQIATKLRALYLSVQEEAIPDRFLDLLEKLDAVERQSMPDVAE